MPNPPPERDGVLIRTCAAAHETRMRDAALNLIDLATAAIPGDAARAAHPAAALNGAVAAAIQMVILRDILPPRDRAADTPHEVSRAALLETFFAAGLGVAHALASMPAQDGVNDRCLKAYLKGFACALEARSQRDAS